MNNENTSNRVYGDPDKYIDVTSRPVLTEEEQRKEAYRESIALRQQKIKQKTDEYIDLINQNHGIRGEHAGQYKLPEIDKKAEEEYGYDTRYIARKQLEERIAKNQKIKDQAKNIKIKQYAMRIIGTALIVGATFAGTVAAIHYSNNMELSEEPSLEQPMPTEEEFNAGLTPEQIQAKQALDEQANAEIMENLGLEQPSQGRRL